MPLSLFSEFLKMIDLHTHSKYSQHGKGDLKELVAQAEKIGLTHIGISEHFPLPKGFVDPAGDSAMKWEDMPKYLQELEEISKNPKIKVLKSAEIDFIPEHYSQIEKEVLNLSNLDYLIGSVHFINQWNFDFSKEVFESGLSEIKYIDMVYSNYYQIERDMINTGWFDVAAHLDLPKIFGYYASKDAGLDETLDCIVDNGLVLEINTSGNHKPVKEQYPSKNIIEKAFKRGIPITFGSDAHDPLHVGRDIKDAVDLAYSIGYRTAVIFEKFNRIEVPLR